MEIVKVVVNRCFGGFGISPEAQLELHKRGCSHITENKLDEYFNGSFYKTDDDKVRHLKMCDIPHMDGIIYLDEHRPSFDNRCCPHLVKLIEEWGSERVSGKCANLHIVEVPSDVKWGIDDYDGSEKIEEYPKRHWKAG